MTIIAYKKRPILRGKDIRRFGFDFANLYLIVTHNGYDNVPRIDINDYPAIKDWLDNGGIAYNGKLYDGYNTLAKRADQGDLPYNLRSCAYMDDFNKPKLCWTPVNSEYRFAVIDSGIYVNNGIFMITGEHLETLCSILNSKLFIFYFNMLLSTGYQYGSKDVFEDLPLNMDLIQKNCISDIDIFDAYHLSEEEKDWISASLK